MIGSSMSSGLSRTLGPLLSSFALAAALGAASEQAGTFHLDGDVERGATLYLKKCQGCHGPEGRGDGALAKSLDPQPRDLTDAVRMRRYADEDLYRLLRDGGEAVGLSSRMPGWSKLATDQEIRDLAAFVRTLASPAD